MKVISAAVLHTFLLLTIFIIPSKAQVMMQSYRTNDLHATYSQSMDEVFGEGSWHKLYFERVNLDSLLSTGISYIYLEGAEYHASYMEDFLTENIGKLENWVLRGGILYINAYPVNGDGMPLGFDGTVLEYPYAVADSIIPAQPGHPLLNGIANPQTLLFTGHNTSSAARAKINGKRLSPLLIQKGDSAVVVLAEKIWGKGKVIFGSLHSMRYVVPQPESFQLHRNILRLQNSPLANNAGLEGMQATVNICPGQHDVSVSLVNYGTSALTNARINWEMNGVPQTPVQWNSLIPPFTNNEAESEQVSIGNISVEANKSYQIKAWLSQVNGAAVSISDTVQQTVYAAMSGTYVIGADSSDFTSLAEAVAALEQTGVCGPVVFNLKPGYYSKAVIQAIPGASETNTITFQSLTRDSTDVTISGALNSFSDNYILHFKGAAHITFRNLTIQATSGWSEYGNVILLEGGAHHLAFVSNRIISRNYQGGGSYTSVIHLMDAYNAPPFSDILIKNNAVMQGSYGIYANLSYNTMSRLTVEGNRFSGHYYGAIYLGYQNEVNIRDNHITGGNSYDYRGIFLHEADRFEITGNEIRMSQGINGFYLVNSAGTAASPALVANNAIIAAGTTNNVAAIFLSSCEAVNVYHNTVNMTNENPGSAAIRTSAGNKDLRVFNNNFCVLGAGYAAQLSFSSPDEIFSDYNNYYSAGTIDFHATGTSTLDLNGWKALTGQDAHSISVDAAFLTPIDYKASKGALDGAGLALAEVRTDKEGKPRDSQHPDIGADEFTAAGADIKFVSLETPVAPFVSGAHEVKVTVNNSGAGDINSFAINWTVNGTAQTPYTWTGQLPKGGSATLVLGTVDFAFRASHNISAVITEVNGAVDTDTSDNAKARNNIYAALPSGNYTIGGTAPDFNSFAEVQQVLNNGGVAGPVSFLVRDGIYNEHIALSSIPGAAPSSKVVFRSESGDSNKVVLAYTAENYDSNYVVKLQNTSYISFSKMTFKAEGASYGHVIVFEGKNTQVRFANNRIIGIENPSYTYHWLVYSSGGPNEEQVFENNLLEFGNYGFYFAGSPSYRTAPSILSGNVLKDQSTYSVYLISQAGFHITGNTITTASTNTSYRGLYLSSCKSDIRILKILCSSM